MEHVARLPTRHRWPPAVVESQQSLAFGVTEFVNRQSADVVSNLVGDSKLLKQPHYFVIEMSGARQTIHLGVTVDRESSDSPLPEQSGQRGSHWTQPYYQNVRFAFHWSLSLSAHGFRSHCRFNRPDTIDLNAHLVAILKPHARIHRSTDAARGSRENHVAWFERQRLSQGCDLIEDVEDQILCIRVLSELAVYEATDAERVWIAELVWGHDPRS